MSSDGSKIFAFATSIFMSTDFGTTWVAKTNILTSGSVYPAMSSDGNRLMMNQRKNRFIWRFIENFPKKNRKKMDCFDILKKKKNISIQHLNKFHGKFDKGYKPKWQSEVFEVKEVSWRKQVHICMCWRMKGETITGAFYEDEMQKTGSGFLPVPNICR